jgi:hypothetical protein
MYKQVENNKFKVIIFLLSEHKIKPEQIIETKVSQIKLSGLQIGGMIINMPEDVIKSLGEYIRDNADRIKEAGYLFPSRKPGEQWTKDNMIIALKSQLKKIDKNLGDLGLKMPNVNKKVELLSLQDIINFLDKTEQTA